ncbi:BA75_01158T0 [Komagataella pastoris]|uniref:BA75_01158T0 n=1 Tax=Komagataella pastoris TaxID=4922 RepID=A0A1B2J5D7_PICPA|nr:BA75_01158T0 [Komagataella pastoris]
MYLNPIEFHKAFRNISKSSLSHTTCRLVIFASSLDVDAICSSKMLTTMFKKHLISFQLIPVIGYTDLKKKFDQLDFDVVNVIILGCGAMVDMVTFLDLNSSQASNKKVYIIDGHRPWNLDNLFSSDNVICFDDGQIDRELVEEREAYNQLLELETEMPRNEDEAEIETDNDEQNDQRGDTDEDADEDADPEDDGELRSRKRHRSQSPPPSQKRKRLLRRSEETIDNYYNQGSTIATSVALQAYTLISSIGETKIDDLWLVILGTTSLMPLYSNVYQKIVPSLKDEVVRLESSVNSSINEHSDVVVENGGHVLSNKSLDTNTLIIEKDYKLFLLRHWNLYNSFFYSNFVNSKLKLYTNDGKKRINKMFAKMGISLQAASQNWHYLDIKMKKRLPAILTRYLHDFQLDGLIEEGFIRNFGFKGVVSAVEYVDSITALLDFNGDLKGRAKKPSKTRTEKSNDETKNTYKDETSPKTQETELLEIITQREAQFISNFWHCYDALTDFKLVKKGLEIAKWQQRFVFDKGFEILEKRMVTNLKVFRLVVLKEASVSWSSSIHSNEMKRFQTSFDDNELTMDLLTNYNKLFRNPLIVMKLGNWLLDCYSEMDSTILPLVIACFDPDSQTYLVCGLPPKFPPEDDGSTLKNIALLNTFSLAFQEVAEQIGAKAKVDSFESSLIELRKEDLPPFLERLSLSGLV